MRNLGHCGCGPEPRLQGLGTGYIDHSGFVTLGGLGDIAPSTTTGGEVGRDIGVGIAAFGLPILYDKLAPKKWPHTKKTWQDVAAVVGLYFLGTYLVRKVI